MTCVSPGQRVESKKSFVPQALQKRQQELQLTNAELVECMRKLGPEQQECLALRFLHGLSVAETAEAMGKRDGAIKALQHRAVRRLAGLLPEGLR